MKKLRFLLLIILLAFFALPSKISAEVLPASYVPHIRIFKYQKLKNGMILVNICWDNIPENFDPEGIITVTGANVIEVEGGNKGIKKMHNTTDNIHFIISKQDASLLSLVYGKPSDSIAGEKPYTIIRSWAFKIA